MAQANAPSAQWTEPAGNRVAVPLTRAYLVRRGERYGFDSTGPSAAALVEAGSGILRLDDAVEAGRRIAVRTGGRILIY
jgi:hypothetical protein